MSSLAQVACEADVVSALQEARALRDHFIFIEVLVDRRDAAPAAAALRQGFMARHFSSIPGYRHLNLGASLAHGSSLTAGHDGCASVRTEATGAGNSGGVAGASPAPSGAEGGGLGGGSGSGLGADPLERRGHTRLVGGGAEAVSSGMGHAVGAGLARVQGMPQTAGSSTCLVAVGEAHLAGAPATTGVAARVSGGAVEGEGTRQRGSSRLGLVPAKRPAQD